MTGATQPVGQAIIYELAAHGAASIYGMASPLYPMCGKRKIPQELFLIFSRQHVTKRPAQTPTKPSQPASPKTTQTPNSSRILSTSPKKKIPSPSLTRSSTPLDASTYGFARQVSWARLRSTIPHQTTCSGALRHTRWRPFSRSSMPRPRWPSS